MKKYQCIYKYTKGPQSTETDQTDSESDTERQHGQNIFFSLLTGFICVDVKPQRHDQVANPPRSAPYENYPAVSKYKLKI